jgi:Domain of unknown function (DUF5011)
MLSSLKKMRGDKKGWYKVSDLMPGIEIAVPSETGNVIWDEIISIKPVGREQVFDIEVEGTHNFVGNDIFAHNTYVLRANTMLAVEGEVNAGSFVVPIGSAAGATSTSALGREIPSSVLTADGKGVDLYKLATFNLANGRALAAKIDAHELRLTALETRLAALESGAVSTATTSPFSLSTTSLASALESFGVFISKGFAQFVKIATDNLQVGSPAHPTGITMYDKTTGQPYCFQIDNGSATTTPGACGEQGIGDREQVIVNPPPVSGDSTPPPAITPPDVSVSTTTATTTSTTTSNLQPITSSGDTTPPVVTLVGAAALEIHVGDTFTDPGATAVDDTDGDLTTKIVVTGAVDTATTGLSTLTYTATDAAGNSASVSRVVTVLASTGSTTLTTGSSPQVAASVASVASSTPSQ